jgi:hypothetical protein
VEESSSSHESSTEDSSDAESKYEMNSINNFTGRNEKGNVHGNFWLTQLQGENAVNHYVAEVVQVTQEAW